MPLMDEFKEQREAIKNASLPVKLSYFWSYYKWHTICVVAALIALTIIICDMATKKEDVLFVALLNAAAPTEEQAVIFRENYIDYAGIDYDKYDVRFDNNFTLNQTDFAEYTLAASQRLLVYTGAGELDVVIGNSEIFPQQATQSMFRDLREILNAEQLEKYEPYFYYIDQAILDEWDRISDEGNIDSEYPDMPEPTKPEEMEQPIPVALFVTDCDTLTDAYSFPGDYVAIGVVANGPNPENALKFIDYLYE